MENSHDQCQTCLEPLDHSINLFDPQHSDLLDVLQLLLGFQVYVEGIEFYVCHNCQRSLIWINEFQTVCLKSLEPLRDVEYIKIEPVVESVSSEDGNSDSDYHLPEPSRKRKQTVRKRVNKVKIETKKRRIESPNKVNCRTALEQFPYSEVLQALKEAQCETVKRTSCLFCAFVSKNDRQFNYHMKGAHKELYADKWCKHCNIKVDDVQEHRNSVRCHVWQCKLCKKKLTGVKTRHLNLHCDSGPTDGKLEQFSVEEVLQALKEVRVPADIKRRQCLLCEFTGDGVDRLKHHMLHSHRTEFNRWCKYCNKLPDNLQDHRDIDKCYGKRCQFCDKIFDNDNTFRSHLKYHCRKDMVYKENNKDESVYEPSESEEDSDSDSDYNYPEPKKKRPRQNGKPGDKRNRERNRRTSSPKRIPRRSSLKQFPYSEVLKAIKEIHIKRIEDKPCIFCAFVGKHEKQFNFHMKGAHKEFYLDKWCKHCNIKVDDVQKHRDAVQCHVWQCKLCKENLTGVKMRHLNLHCDGKTAEGRLQQFPVAEVLQALKESRVPANRKRRECLLCDFLGEDVDTLKNHMLDSHINEFDKWCKYCNKMPSNLERHRDIEKCYGERCKFCNQILSDIYFKPHLRYHCRKELLRKVNGSLISLEKAGINLTTEEESSLSSMHVDVPNKVANNGLQNQPQISPSPETNLKKEDEEEEGKEDYIHLCPFCGQTFKTEKGANNHILSHYGERKSKCSTCNKSFLTKSALGIHEMAHKKAMAFVCQICGKCSAYEAIHKRHMETHEVGPVKCTICDKKFPRPGRLKLHMRHHTGENKFRCIPCGKSFHMKCLLVKHMIVHKSDDYRPHKCNFCGKRFKGKQTMRLHEMLHTGYKRYKCSICAFGCIKAKSLTDHMKKHPEDVPQANKPHNCQLCYVSFSTNALLMCHIVNCHKNYGKLILI